MNNRTCATCVYYDDDGLDPMCQHVDGLEDPRPEMSCPNWEEKVIEVGTE